MKQDRRFCAATYCTKYHVDFCIIRPVSYEIIMFILISLSRSWRSGLGFCYLYHLKISGVINHTTRSNEWKVLAGFPRILPYCKYGISACCKSEAKHCPMLQCITQTLQRTICINPVNTIAIELQMMIMPYWYWLNCYMPSLTVIWLELYTTTRCLCSGRCGIRKALHGTQFQQSCIHRYFSVRIVIVGVLNIHYKTIFASKYYIQSHIFGHVVSYI